MILDQISVADYISLYGLGFITTLFFLIFGIMVVVTKNTNLIDKNARFYNEQTFMKIYGWVNIIGSLIMTALLVVALIDVHLNLTMFVILTVVVITILIIQHMLLKKYKIDVKK